MSWIRAHLTPAEATTGGLSALDHAGNAAADHAALAKARELQPPLNHRLARSKLRQAVKAAQSMILLVKLPLLLPIVGVCRAFGRKEN